MHYFLYYTSKSEMTEEIDFVLWNEEQDYINRKNHEAF